MSRTGIRHSAAWSQPIITFTVATPEHSLASAPQDPQPDVH